MKRIRNKKCAPGQLRMFWGRPEPGEDPDIVLAWGGDGATKRDTILLHLYMCHERPDPKLGGPQTWSPSLIKELEDRGYDLSTLEFSIKKKSKT